MNKIITFFCTFLLSYNISYAEEDIYLNGKDVACHPFVLTSDRGKSENEITELIKKQIPSDIYHKTNYAHIIRFKDKTLFSKKGKVEFWELKLITGELSKHNFYYYPSLTQIKIYPKIFESDAIFIIDRKTLKSEWTDCEIIEIDYDVEERLSGHKEYILSILEKDNLI